MTSLTGTERNMLKSIGWQCVSESCQGKHLLLTQIGVDLPGQVFQQFREIAKNARDVQLLLERLKNLLLSLGTPNISHQIGMARTHIVQRLFAIQVLWAGNKRETLVSKGVIGVCPLPVSLG